MALPGINLSLMGVFILTLASLSIGLEAGVVMAGRADSRGTVYHYVASGIWGGFFSLVAGIMTMMADSRLHPLPTEERKKQTVTLGHAFHVVPFYRPFFVVLFATSLIGFASAIVTISMSAAIIHVSQPFCDFDDIQQLWTFFHLFCYAGIASICLIPTGICLVLLHLLVIIFCVRTVRQPHWISRDEYEQLQRQSQTTSINSIAQKMHGYDGPAMEMATNGAARPYESGPGPRSSQSLPTAGRSQADTGLSRSISELPRIKEETDVESSRHQLI